MESRDSMCLSTRSSSSPDTVRGEALQGGNLGNTAPYYWIDGKAKWQWLGVTLHNHLRSGNEGNTIGKKWPGQSQGGLERDFHPEPSHGPHPRRKWKQKTSEWQFFMLGQVRGEKPEERQSWSVHTVIVTQQGLESMFPLCPQAWIPSSALKQEYWGRKGVQHPGSCTVL